MNLKLLSTCTFTHTAKCECIHDSLLMALCSSRRVGVPGRVYDAVVLAGVTPGVRADMIG